MASNSIKSYKMAYLVFIELLREEKINNGIINALKAIQDFLNIDNISIFKSEKKRYKTIFNVKQERTTFNPLKLEKAVNINKDFLEERKFTFIPKKDKSILRSSFFFYIKAGENKYILSLSNIKNKDLDIKDFYNRLLIIFPLIIKMVIKEENEKKLVYEDPLTGLLNRAKFNKKLNEIDKSDKQYMLGIYDLFRLKFINDNFSHDEGDNYIVNAAEILKDVFDITDKASIYRIGGDEYVVIAEGDNLEIFKLLSDMCSEKVKKLDFGIQNNIPLDLNYGIHLREKNESGKEMYIKADKKLQKNKTQVYKTLGLDRRS